MARFDCKIAMLAPKELPEGPHLDWDAGVLGVVAKDANPPALGELAALVVEVLRDADALHHRPGLAGAQQSRREDDGVKRYVVLAHELRHAFTASSATHYY
eukprot:scaffold188394_cov29-Prasinocladus_malaysianus.AAC.1